MTHFKSTFIVFTLFIFIWYLSAQMAEMSTDIALVQKRIVKANVQNPPMTEAD